MRFVTNERRMRNMRLDFSAPSSVAWLESVHLTSRHSSFGTGWLEWLLSWKNEDLYLLPLLQFYVFALHKTIPMLDHDSPVKNWANRRA